MKKNFSYLLSEDEQKTSIPRVDIIVCTVFIAALLFGYLNARYLHWV